MKQCFLSLRRYRAGSDNDCKMNGSVDHLELERFKQEILVEIRKEMNKMKMEIIDGMIDLICAPFCLDRLSTVRYRSQELGDEIAIFHPF